MSNAEWRIAFEQLNEKIETVKNLVQQDYNHTSMLVKFVVLPLIIILGGLVGIKVAM